MALSDRYISIDSITVSWETLHDVTMSRIAPIAIGAPQSRGCRDPLRTVSIMVTDHSNGNNSSAKSTFS